MSAKLKACILNLKACLDISVNALKVLDRNKISDDIARNALREIEVRIDSGLIENALANDNSTGDWALKPYQHRVNGWMMECFSMEVCRDKMERNHRFLEEALELVQSNGCTASEAHQLVDYTFSRPVGEIKQECGGVMVTLAALCLASDIDMAECGEVELSRILKPEVMEKIRAKQSVKPKHSPLPSAPTHDAVRDA